MSGSRVAAPAGAGTKVRPSPPGAPRPGTPSFELSESKLLAPQGTAGSVPRTALLERLQRSRQSPVVVISAGPGYGKTTLLSQWGSRSRRPFAWLALDDGDNDPVVFLTYVATALDRVTPLGPDVFDALGSPSVSIEGTAIPRLGAAIASMPRSVVLILEDLHLLRDRQCLDAVDELTRHLPAGSQMALSTRGEPTRSIGARRAAGTLLEIGPEDLKMEGDEARQLLEAAEVSVGDDELAALNEHAEGWAAGLYLAALSMRSSGRGMKRVTDFRGGDRFIAEYLKSELFESLSPDEFRFLTRTSVLSRLSGPLCDAVLESKGSAEVLESLQRKNRFVLPLDHEREWYRYHHLFEELLQAELDRSDPGLAPELCRRAARWWESHGQPEEAVSYAQQAEDVDLVATLVVRYGNEVFESGRAATTETWLNWLDENGGVERNQAVAVQGAMARSVLGQAAAAERWADAAEKGSFNGTLPDGSASIESWLAMLRAFRGSGGAERIRPDAEYAVENLARSSPWRAAAMVVLALSCWVLADSEEADDLFAQVAEESLDLGVPSATTLSLAERGTIAIERNEWGEAEGFAHRALLMLRNFRMEETPLNTLVYAVAARVALHRGDARRASEMLTRAQRLRPKLTHAIAILPVQTRLELARAYLALGDAAGAGTMLREVDVLLRSLPDLGELPAQAEEIRSQLRTVGREAAGASTLTAAELRLLPQLVTHLSFREIGERLFISQHTVKTQAVSIYRKLGVTSRSGAVECAREIGLL